MENGTHYVVTLSEEMTTEKISAHDSFDEADQAARVHRAKHPGCYFEIATDANMRTVEYYLMEQSFCGHMLKGKIKLENMSDKVVVDYLNESTRMGRTLKA